MNSTVPVSALRKEIIGIETLVPVLDGTEQRYVFLDNAASTPTFRHVLDALVEYFIKHGNYLTLVTVVKDPVRTRFVYRDSLWQGADLLGLGVASFSHVGTSSERTRSFHGTVEENAKSPSLGNEG